MKNLLVHDLKNLSANKEVSDTIRKLALRMFKQKWRRRTEGRVVSRWSSSFAVWMRSKPCFNGR